MTATTISVEGDRTFVKQIKKLAVLRDQKVAVLVRAALDQAYGADLQKLSETLFFESSDACTHQSPTNGGMIKNE